MNEIVYLLYQLLPVIIGVLFLVVMRLLNLTTSRISISTFEIDELVEDYAQKSNKQQTESNFLRLREHLIINGKLPKNANLDLFDYALHYAGIASYTSLDSLQGSLKGYKPKTLTIILNDSRLISRKFIQSNVTSGILFAYSIEQKLEIVSECI